MASLVIHQIIGEKYCELNNIAHKQEFLKGNISPDILPNKEESHYKTPRPQKIYLDIIKDRVNLSAFCKDKKLIDDYTCGYFLHLVTDYIFYNILIIGSNKFQDFCSAPPEISSAKMYKEYDRIAYHLLSTFPNTDISRLPKNTTTTTNEDLTIFNKTELLKFIEICSKLDLKQIYKDISNNDYTTLNSIVF